MTAVEMKVIFKGEDWTFSKKFLVYDALSLDEDDKQVKECIQDAEGCVCLTPSDVSLKISKVIQ